MTDARAPIDILLADDSDAFATSLAAELATSGEARVSRVGACGQEILAAALRLKPDVVLLDASLRDGDGLEVTRRLRAALPETEVLVLALHPSGAYQRRALAAGARALIGKAQLPDLERALHDLRQRKEIPEVPRAMGEEVTRELMPARGGVDIDDVERLQRLELSGVMAAGMAHDMASPIQTMKLELAALARTMNELDAALGAEGAAPPRARAALARACSTALALDEVSDYLQRMTRDFVRFARGSAPVPATTEVRAAIDVAVRYTRSSVAHRASLALRVPRALSAAIAERTLARVMINLIMNASSAFGTGDPARNWIVVTAESSAAAVHIEVTDNAGGVPPEVRDQLFSPFAGGARRGRSPNGLGIGLAVARALVREVGGDLTLVATGADETRFRCTVPAG